MLSKEARGELSEANAVDLPTRRAWIEASRYIVKGLICVAYMSFLGDDCGCGDFKPLSIVGKYVCRHQRPPGFAVF